jgi:hypothetical protein
MSLLHIPILRQGKVYESLDKTEVGDHRGGGAIAQISQANGGLIRKDMRKITLAREILRSHSCEELLEITRQAGELFLNKPLPLFEGGALQSPQDYIETLSATSGLPFTLVRRNMARIYQVFTEMPTILKGLMRGLDLKVIDDGIGWQSDVAVSYFSVGQSLGLVLPSNSPGVNSLWMPAIALKTPVVVKPGSEEPWTPCRIMQAFISAGCPPEAFSFYPTDHQGAGVIMEECERALIFGGEETVKQYAGNPGVQVHGPGWSKVIIGEDKIDSWPDYLPVLADSVMSNGGRSCINASAIVVPRHGRAIAEALAEKMGEIEPRPMDDEQACLSGFANRKMADFIDTSITGGLSEPGGEELTAKYHANGRKVELNGSLFMLPTVIFTENAGHTLFNREFLFPYVAVTEVDQANMLGMLGPSLVVTAITDDERLKKQILSSPHIDRLNVGPVATSMIHWDQPHEGNLFEFLYRRRAIYQVTS